MYVPSFTIYRYAIFHVCMQFASKFTILEQEEYASAGAVAVEVLSAIKTVVAFGGEEKDFQRYAWIGMILTQ